MASKRGGKRAGAGRPSSAVSHAEAEKGFRRQCASKLLASFDRLWYLADGGFERVELKYEPAGSFTVKAIAKDAGGEPIRGARGGLTFVDEPLYPDLDPDALVLVERRVSYAEPHFKALELIVERSLGTPRPEAEVAADVLEIRAALTAAVAAIAARKARPPASDEPPPTPPTPADDDEPE